LALFEVLHRSYAQKGHKKVKLAQARNIGVGVWGAKNDLF